MVALTPAQQQLLKRVCKYGAEGEFDGNRLAFDFDQDGYERDDFNVLVHSVLSTQYGNFWHLLVYYCLDKHLAQSSNPDGMDGSDDMQAVVLEEDILKLLLFSKDAGVSMYHVDNKGEVAQDLLIENVTDSATLSILKPLFKWFLHYRKPIDKATILTNLQLLDVVAGPEDKQVILKRCLQQALSCSDDQLHKSILKAQQEKYIGHYFEVTGKSQNQENREDWHKDSYLALHIYLLYRCLSFGERNVEASLSADQIIDVLLESIECYQYLRDIQRMKKFGGFYCIDQSSIPDELLDPFVEGLKDKLLALTEGQHYLLATGWRTHAIYVDLIRTERSLQVFIDNLGAGVDARTGRIIRIDPLHKRHKGRYCRHEVGYISIEVLPQMLKKQILSLDLSGSESDRAMKMIYPQMYEASLPESVREVSCEGRAERNIALPAQQIRNCVFENYRIHYVAEFGDKWKILEAELSSICQDLSEIQNNDSLFSAAYSTWVMFQQKVAYMVAKQFGQNKLTSYFYYLQSHEATNWRTHVQPFYIQPSFAKELGSSDKDWRLWFNEQFAYEHSVAVEASVTVVLGEAGMGKSSFTHYLMDWCWKNPVRYTPILVNLTHYRDCWEKDQMTIPLNADVVGSRIQSTMINCLRDMSGTTDHHSYLIFLDGVDELLPFLRKHKKPLAFSRLSKTYPKSRVMLLMREDGFLSRESDQLLLSLNEWTQVKFFYLQYLTAQKVNHFIQQYLSSELHQSDHSQRIEDTKRQALRQMEALTRVPLLLRLFVDAYPKLNTLSEAHEPSRRFELYRLCMQQYFARAVKNRGHQADSLPSIPMLQEFSENLAVQWMKSANESENQSDSGQGVSHRHLVRIVSSRLTTSWFEISNSPIENYDNGGYGFTHASFREYFFACAILRRLKIYDDNLEVREITVDGWFDASVDTGDLNYAHSEVGGLLDLMRLCSLREQHNVLYFIAAGVNNSQYNGMGAYAHCVRLIRASRQTTVVSVLSEDLVKQLSWLAGNLLTILSYAGYNFSDYGQHKDTHDFSSIRAHNADLSHILGDQADFSRSVFTGETDLSRSWLRKANFNQCYFERLTFRQIPPLLFEDTTQVIGFTRDSEPCVLFADGCYLFIKFLLTNRLQKRAFASVIDSFALLNSRVVVVLGNKEIVNFDLLDSSSSPLRFSHQWQYDVSSIALIDDYTVLVWLFDAHVCLLHWCGDNGLVTPVPIAWFSGDYCLYPHPYESYLVTWNQQQLYSYSLTPHISESPLSTYQYTNGLKIVKVARVNQQYLAILVKQEHELACVLEIRSISNFDCCYHSIQLAYTPKCITALSDQYLLSYVVGDSCTELYVLDWQVGLQQRRIDRFRDVIVSGNARLLTFDDQTVGLLADNRLQCWGINLSASDRQAGLFVRPANKITDLYITQDQVVARHYAGVEGWQKRDQFLLRKSYLPAQLKTVNPIQLASRLAYLRIAGARLEIAFDASDEWRLLHHLMGGIQIRAWLVLSVNKRAHVLLLDACNNLHVVRLSSIGCLEAVHTAIDIGLPTASHNLLRRFFPIVSQGAFGLLFVDRDGRFYQRFFTTDPTGWGERESMRVQSAQLEAQPVFNNPLWIKKCWYHNREVMILMGDKRLFICDLSGQVRQGFCDSQYSAVAYFSHANARFLVTGDKFGKIKFWRKPQDQQYYVAELKLDFSAAIDELKVEERAHSNGEKKYYLYTGAGSALGCWLLHIEEHSIHAYLHWCSGRRLLLSETSFAELPQPLASHDQAMLDSHNA